MDAKDRDFFWSVPGSWTALAILVGAYFLKDQIETAIYHPVAHLIGLHMIEGGMMSLAPYGVLMVVRLVWNLVLVAAVCFTLRQPLWGFPLWGPRVGRYAALGLLIGLFVMVAAILGIIIAGGAIVQPAKQSASAAIANGSGWLLFDFVGATGEELYGRVAVILVAARFFGWKGAIVVSGLTFFALHLNNPGASTVWLLRLFLQGVLLAYAVYRTGSVWWSAAYHTGWNWASAPLFGAAGSGYLDRGHLFEFTPTGPSWLTGGAVGPEGSAFAFVAVLAALGLLWLATHQKAGTTTTHDC